MPDPLISIVMCTYNGAAYLETQLQSLFDQTYPNLEIIISDDASTDATPTILERYRNRPNIALHLHANNVGFTKNFEQAALLAKGDFICFCDQDDIWLPQKVERLYQHIGNHSMVYSNSLLIDENGHSLNKYLSNFRALQSIYDSRGFGYLNAVSGHTMMIRKELLKDCLPIPENCYHDWWIAIQAANRDGIFYLDEVLTHYRQHSKTVTKNIIVKTSGSRTYSKRYEDYLNDLKWLEILKNNPLTTQKQFYETYYDLYRQKIGVGYNWKFMWFLLKNRKHIFRFSTKKVTSHLFEIRKMARKEKAE